MENIPTLAPKELLAIELDFRLNYLYGVVEDSELSDYEKNTLYAAMRMSYAQGYIDALTEKIAGQLLIDCPGFRIKNRQR